MSLIQATASDLLDQLSEESTSSVELTTACLDRIETHDEMIGAFLRVDREAALSRAAEIDARRGAGESLGPLAGLPIAIKDLLCTRGEVTTCASRMLENFRPPYNATVVERLLDADAVLIGKTNMDEFAMGGSTENSAYRVCRNPWDTDRVPGGSSGGSAACVAAQMAPLSIGSDTGGSIRQPAGLCGVTGLKPTYGRVSRYGLIAFASSLDQIGPLGGSALDVARLLEVIAGHDPNDSTSINAPVPEYRKSLDQPRANLTLGVVKEHLESLADSEVAAAVEQALDVYRKAGVTIKEISLPHSKYAIATYYIIAPSEASSNLARYDGAHYGYRTDAKKVTAELTAERKALEAAGDQRGLDRLDDPLVRMYRLSRSEGFGPEVKRRVMLGTYALSAGYYDAYYLKALKVRRLIADDFRKAFAEVDLLVGPVTPSTAEPIGQFDDDPLGLYLTDLFTVGANLAGIPGISVPCGLSSSGLPIGLQLQGPALGEEQLLQAAHLFQQATDWHTRRPTL